jgi:hypothetical protein
MVESKDVENENEGEGKDVRVWVGVRAVSTPISYHFQHFDIFIFNQSIENFIF